TIPRYERAVLNCVAPGAGEAARRAQRSAARCKDGLLAALDRLDVVHSATIPVGTEPRTPRCGEVVKQARHRTAGPVGREELVTTEGGFPFALAAGDKNGCARLVGKPVERALDCYLAAASLPGSRARIGQHVGPHSSVVGSCGCGQERLSTASRAC